MFVAKSLPLVSRFLFNRRVGFAVTVVAAGAFYISWRRAYNRPGMRGLDRLAPEITTKGMLFWWQRTDLATLAPLIEKEIKQIKQDQTGFNQEVQMATQLLNRYRLSTFHHLASYGKKELSKRYDELRKTCPGLPENAINVYFNFIPTLEQARRIRMVTQRVGSINWDDLSLIKDRLIAIQPTLFIRMISHAATYFSKDMADMVDQIKGSPILEQVDSLHQRRIQELDEKLTLLKDLKEVKLYEGNDGARLVVFKKNGFGAFNLKEASYVHPDGLYAKYNHVRPMTSADDLSGVFAQMVKRGLPCPVAHLRDFLVVGANGNPILLYEPKWQAIGPLKFAELEKFLLDLSGGNAQIFDQLVDRYLASWEQATTHRQKVLEGNSGPLYQHAANELKREVEACGKALQEQYDVVFNGDLNQEISKCIKPVFHFPKGYSQVLMHRLLKKHKWPLRGDIHQDSPKKRKFDQACKDISDRALLIPEACGVYNEGDKTEIRRALLSQGATQEQLKEWPKGCSIS